MADALSSAEEVTEDVLRDAEHIYDSFYTGSGAIDWEEFIDRMAKISERYDFEEYDSPAVRKIQRHVRRIKRESE